MLVMMGNILSVASLALAEETGKYQLAVNPVTGKVFKIDSQTGQVYLYKTPEDILAEVKSFREEEKKITDAKEKQEWNLMIMKQLMGSAYGYFIPVPTHSSHP